MTISNKEAEELLNMEKHYKGDTQYSYPSNINIPLYSQDNKIEFSLDISANAIKISKRKYQNRVYSNIVLLRIDIGGSPHTNPDGQVIECPHIHFYREGYDDKWAEPLPKNLFSCDDIFKMLDDFMNYCHVVTKPVIQKSVFEYDKYKR